LDSMHVTLANSVIKIIQSRFIRPNLAPTPTDAESSPPSTTLVKRRYHITRSTRLDMPQLAGPLPPRRVPRASATGARPSNKETPGSRAVAVFPLKAGGLPERKFPPLAVARVNWIQNYEIKTFQRSETRAGTVFTDVSKATDTMKQHIGGIFSPKDYIITSQLQKTPNFPTLTHHSHSTPPPKHLQRLLWSPLETPSAHVCGPQPDAHSSFPGAGRIAQDLAALRRTYGPIGRITPDEVSFTGPSAWGAILQPKRCAGWYRMRRRWGPWWGRFAGGFGTRRVSRLMRSPGRVRAVIELADQRHVRVLPRLRPALRSRKSSDPFTSAVQSQRRALDSSRTPHSQPGPGDWRWLSKKEGSDARLCC
jgi:hypothetical protein